MLHSETVDNSGSPSGSSKSTHNEALVPRMGLRRGGKTDCTEPSKGVQTLFARALRRMGRPCTVTRENPPPEW